MPNSISNSIIQTIQNIKAFVEQNESSTPDDTVKTSFQTSQSVSARYMVYRWIQFAAHLFIYLASFFDFKRSWTPAFTAAYTVRRGPKYYAKWFLYLTHWGVFLNAIQSLLGVVVLSMAFKNRQNQTPNAVFGVPLKLATFYRYTFGVALNLSVWISVGFWALIYDPVYFNIDLVTLSQHGLCTLLLLLDMFVVKFPYKLFTGLWTCVLCAAYENILIGHYMVGALDRYQDRPYLYEVQNWSTNPFGAAIVTFSAMLTVISFNFLLWGLYQVKRQFIEVRHTNSY